MSETDSSSISAAQPADVLPVIEYAPVEAVPAVKPWIGSRAETRLWSGMILGLSGSMLGLGRWMTPSVHGLGTHAENLGLPPCGFYHYFGIPCPTCGCTTAVTWLAHGHVGMAFFVQPFGAVVGLLGVAGVALGLIGLMTGRWRGPKLFTLQLHCHRLLWASGLLIGAAWGYKIVMVKLGYC